jgi:hypothetical protein
MDGTRSAWLAARRVVTVAWLGIGSLQFVIWMMICLVGWHFADPFWLWTAAVGGVLVGGMWAVPAKSGAGR